MLLGGERLGLPLKQPQAVQTGVTQCLSIPVPYANAIPCVLVISAQEIPPECPVAISTGQRLSFCGWLWLVSVWCWTVAELFSVHASNASLNTAPRSTPVSAGAYMSSMPRTILIHLIFLYSSEMLNPASQSTRKYFLWKITLALASQRYYTLFKISAVLLSTKIPWGWFT